MSAPNAVSVVIYGDDQTQAAIRSVNSNLIEMKRRGEDSVGSLRAETREAKAGMAALGEEIGIAIPRHLRTALAEFDILRKAFAGVAFGLELGLGIEVFNKLKEKIPEITDAIMGFGEEEKKAYKQAIDDNKKYIEQQTQIRDLQRQIILDGLTGAARSGKAAEFAVGDKDALKKQLDSRIEEFRKAQQKIQGLSDQIDNLAIGAGVSMQSDNRGTIRLLKTQMEEAEKEAGKLESVIVDLNNQLSIAGDKSKLLANAAGREQIDAAKKAYQDYIDARLAGQKSIDEISKANQKRDQDEVAMINALAGDGKVLNHVLNDAFAAIQGPFDGMEKLGGRIKDIFAQVEAETQKVKTAEENLDVTTIEGDKEINALREKARAQLQGMIADYKALAKASGDPKLIQNSEEYEKKLEATKVQLDSIRKDALQKLTQDTENFFAGFLDGSKTGAAAFADFGKAILATLAQIEARMLAIWLIEKVTHLFGSFAGGGSSSAVGDAGSLTPGGIDPGDIHAAAGGGTFGTGDLSWVGEEGPELVRFGAAATVIPHSASMAMAGSGGGNTVNIDARGAQAGVSQEITNAIRLSEERAVARATIQMREIQRRRA